MYAMCMKPFNGSRFNLGAKEAKKIEPRKKPLSKLIALDFFFWTSKRANKPNVCAFGQRDGTNIYKCIEKKTARDFGNILNDQKQGKKSALLEYRLCELWTLDGNL